MLQEYGQELDGEENHGTQKHFFTLIFQKHKHFSSFLEKIVKLVVETFFYLFNISLQVDS